MALNIAVPIPSVGDLLEVFGLLSPISPVNIDCHSGGLKALVSPVGSESSGVSSLDLEDLKVSVLIAISVWKDWRTFFLR